MNLEIKKYNNCLNNKEYNNDISILNNNNNSFIEAEHKRNEFTKMKLNNLRNQLSEILSPSQKNNEIKKNNSYKGNNNIIKNVNSFSNYNNNSFILDNYNINNNISYSNNYNLTENNFILENDDKKKENKKIDAKLIYFKGIKKKKKYL